MSEEDKRFYIALSVFGTLFGCGIYGCMERNFLGGIPLIALGITGFIIMRNPNLKEKYLSNPLGTITLLLITWVFIGYSIWGNHVNDEKNKELSPLNPSIASILPYIQKMGPIHTLNGFSEAKEVIKRLNETNSSVLIVSKPEDQEFRRDIENIFNGAQNLMFFEGDKEILRTPFIAHMPLDGKDIDVPKIMSSGEEGIVVYGDSQIENNIRNFLGQCFVVKKSAKAHIELDGYFKRHIVLIEIGDGPHWLNPMSMEHSRCDE